MLAQYLGDSPAYVDGFKDGVKRSCEGSLHFYPKKVIELTEDEFSHIEKTRKDVLKSLRVLQKSSPESTQSEPVKEPAVESQVSVPSDTFKSSEKKKKVKAYNESEDKPEM